MAGKKKRNHNNLTPKEQEFCDYYSRYAGNLSKVASAMHISLQVCSSTYLNCDRVKEYLNSTMQRTRDRLLQSLPALLDNAVEMVHKDDVPYNVKSQLTIALMDRAGL